MMIYTLHNDKQVRFKRYKVIWRLLTTEINDLIKSMFQYLDRFYKPYPEEGTVNLASEF